MYYDEERGSGFMAGLLIGVLLGASAALLAAPDSGQIMRQRLIQVVAPRRSRSVAEDDYELAGNRRAAARSGRRRARR